MLTCLACSCSYVLKYRKQTSESKLLIHVKVSVTYEHRLECGLVIKLCSTLVSFSSFIKVDCQRNLQLKI